jgi:hypothetical protein
MTKMKTALSNLVLTIDIDWAPDFIIEHVANILIKQQVKATWFVTHSSPALSLLRANTQLFELGIHPNFLPNSTHGINPKQVLNHCISLVPEARSMRTHSLTQSTPLLNQVLTLTPIILDSSIYLPHMEGIQPISYWWHGKELLRLPIFWEDDLEMERPDSCWTLEAVTHYKEGLKIFDFHPIHIVLNSRNDEAYQRLKSKKKIQDLTMSEIEPNINRGIGTLTLFMDLVEYLSKNKKLQYNIGDIIKDWREAQPII